VNVKASSVFRSFENIFVVTVLFLSTSALLPFRRGPSSSVADLAQSDPITQLVWIGMYGITVLLVLARWRQVVYVVMREKLLLLLLGIAMISLLWSVAPELTLRRSVALTGTTLFGAYLATRYSRSELLWLLAWAFSIAALLSIVFVLALPSYGIFDDPRGPTWRGIYFHKNTLGRTMALSALVFLFLAVGSRQRRWITWVGLGLSVAVLVLSKSITSWASFLTIIALWPLFKVLRWRHALAVSIYVLAVLVGVIATAWLGSNAEGILSAVGRDTTLSGRTVLWSMLLDVVQQRPWLGYGYGAFWEGGTGASALLYNWLWTTGFGYHLSADNGILDLWLHLGLLGVLVFLCGFVRAFWRAVVWARLTTTTEGLWPLAYLTFMLVFNLFESAILAYNSILWILYVEASLSVAGVASVASGLGNISVTLNKRMTRNDSVPSKPAKR
jgi:exopolysaccharide production protein ExoQ